MKRPWLLLAAVVVCSWQVALAGGPLYVGGPNFGIEGQPFTWDPAAMPVQYRVDGGPLARTASGDVVSHVQGVSRVNQMFQVWAVPGTVLSLANAGPIVSTGAFTDGDVSTVAEYDAVSASCNAGQQSPVIFDADGSISADLGIDPHVIAFTRICKLDGASGHIVAAMVMLDGRWQDGITNTTVHNHELTSAQFDEAMAHEFGHFLGLDHSQINDGFDCSVDSVAGRPLMYPISQCDARSSLGLPTLATDDAAWISKLYPSPAFGTSYGTISGFILFSDGLSHAQGVNVIARQVDDPNTPGNESLRVAVSVVSGYLFTGDPGQPALTNYLPCVPVNRCPGGFFGNFAAGSKYGSRNPLLLGYYEIPVPPGTYTVEVQSINSAFEGGSGVGPLDPPIAMPGSGPEFWNTDEAAFDSPTAKSEITVAAGQTVKDINIILNGTPPRFDQFEGSARLFWPQPRDGVMGREPRAAREWGSWA